MKSLNRPIVLAVLAALGVAMAVGVYLALPQRVPAPEATFTTIEGQTLATADLRGDIVKRYLGEPDFAALHSLLESKLDEKT